MEVTKSLHPANTIMLSNFYIKLGALEFLIYDILNFFLLYDLLEKRKWSSFKNQDVHAWKCYWMGLSFFQYIHSQRMPLIVLKMKQASNQTHKIWNQRHPN